MSKPSNGLYSFGSYRLDATARLLMRSGELVTLPPKTFDLLVLMAGSAGRLLTKRELMETLWNGAFVEEANLSFQMSSLRKALGEEGNSWIEAVPKHGYRFKAPVTCPDAADPHPPARPTAPTRRALPGVLLLSITVLGGLAFGWYSWRRIRPEAPPRPAERQLTANPAEAWVTGAAISPDGQYIAYNDQTGLNLRWIDSGETRRIPLPPGFQERIWDVTWLPDGWELLAIGARPEGYDLWKITAMGAAAPRLLYPDAWEPAASPNGREVAFLSPKGAGSQRVPGIWVGGMNGEAPRRIAGIKEDEFLFSPTWSPDGRWIAYVRVWRAGEGHYNTAIQVQPASGGPAKTIVSYASLPKSSLICYLGASGSCLSWAASWRLVFSVRGSAEAGSTPEGNSLWQILTKEDTAEAAGKAERLAAWNDLGPLSPSISADGKRLVFLKSNSWQDVYLAEVAADGARMQPPRRFTLDNRGSRPSGWTTDGQAILLDSERNGRGEIFKQSLKESLAEVVVQSPADDCEGGVQSADGSWLLYRESRHAASNMPSAPSRLMRRPATGGSSEMVFEEPAGLVWSYACPVKPDHSCILSRKEGRDLVFYQLDAVRGKGAELGRTKATDWNGWGVSPDGSRLALARDKGRIEVLSIGDRAWREIALEPGWERLQTAAWASDGKSFYATCWLPDSFALIHVTLAGKVTSLLHYGHRQFLSYPLPSPNGKYLAFQAETSDSNVWLIENAGLERR